MSNNPNLVQYIAEQCAGAGKITVKKMFGDYGIYCDGAIFCKNLRKRNGRCSAPHPAGRGRHRWARRGTDRAPAARVMGACGKSNAPGPAPTERQHKGVGIYK